MEKFPLKVHRAMCGMSQKEVAAEVGVNRMTYANWEKYETFPDAVQLIKLAQVFKCSMDAFYFPLDAS